MTSRWRLTWWNDRTDEHPMIRWYSGSEAEKDARSDYDKRRVEQHPTLHEWVDGDWQRR